MPEATQPSPRERGGERARLVALPGGQSARRARRPLASEVSSFVGRQDELSEIVRLLRAHRLVTVTGVGGSGKTRLALAVASELDEIFADGLWVVELTALDVVLVVLVVNEELGWRGYALPKLLERFSPLVASVVLGLLWGLWHLPTFFIPGTPQHGQPIVAFLLLTVAYSILLTFIWGPTAGSVLVATLAHGSINLSQGLFLAEADPALRYWLLVISYGVAGLVLAVLLRTRTSGPVEARTG